MGEVGVMLAHRAMAGDWTDDEVLLMAKSRPTIRVSKYAVRDVKLLNAVQRLAKKGLLKFVCEDRGVLYYRLK